MGNKISRVLAVGADGPFAGLVVPALAKRGIEVRGLVRKSDQEQSVRARGAPEVVVGDIHDRNQMAAALAGMEAAFYISPFALDKEADAGKQFIAAARSAGVRRVVFSSVLHSNLAGLENHAAKLPIEEAILDSGLEYTILQPGVFFQNMKDGWQRAQQTGVYAEPWSNDTRFSRVDYRDVAEVAAIALTEDRLLYGTFQLCAEGNLNRREVAALMSQVLGRPVEAQQAPLPASGAVPDQLIEMMRWYDEHSLLGNPIPLRAILDSKARTLRDYLTELLEQA